MTTPTVYSASGTRGVLVEWYLSEIGAPCELVKLDMKGGENKAPAFTAVNPFGKVPALSEAQSGGEGGPWSLFESGALLQYLGERYDPNYPGADDVRGRAEAAQWILFANSTLSQAMASERARETQLDGIMRALDSIFAERDYAMRGRNDGAGSGTFGAADVALGGYLSFATRMFGVDLSPYRNVQAYVQRITQREAFREHVGGGGSGGSGSA